MSDQQPGIDTDDTEKMAAQIAEAADRRRIALKATILRAIEEARAEDREEIERLRGDKLFAEAEATRLGHLKIAAAREIETMRRERDEARKQLDVMGAEIADGYLRERGHLRAVLGRVVGMAERGINAVASIGTDNRTASLQTRGEALRLFETIKAEAAPLVKEK